jgi:peptide/nickel transport system ATP-binding protein
MRSTKSAILRFDPCDESGGNVSLLEVRDLSVDYALEDGACGAVDRVSFDVEPGQFVAIVGESGCGKSTLLFAISQLLNPPAEITGGSVTFMGQNLVVMNAKQLAPIRWRNMSVVMQSAMNALNPVMKVKTQFADAMRAHGEHSAEVIRERSEAVMELVCIDKAHLDSYPHQLSGGMRQRTMVAMALLFTPELVIMDEPTSALDVVAQRSLMVQVKDLQRRLGFAVIFVTHDMSLVSHFSDQLIVMYAGQAVEFGHTRQLFDAPSHPYSQGLLDAFPSIKGPRPALSGIPGSPPDLSHPPNGCRFHPRCPFAFDRCHVEEPEMYDVAGVLSRCHRHEAKDVLSKGVVP